jgi:hypothetical protein
MIKSRRKKWVGPLVRMVEKNPYRLLVGKPGGKRLLERAFHKIVENS